MNEYGDITARTAGFVVAEYLKRGLPLLCLEKVLQLVVISKNNTKTAKWRRWNSLDSTPANLALVEGVTPTGQDMTHTDVEANLSQYGGLIEFTDVVIDTNDDFPEALREWVNIQGEQIAQLVEKIRYLVVRAGTNKFYSTGTARTDVNVAFSAGLQKKIVRALKRQNAQFMTEIVKSTPSFNTEAVLPAFWGFAHIDCEDDIRSATGFIDAKDYGTTRPVEGEVGSIGNCRYILSNIFEPYASGGAAYNGSGTAMITTDGVSADVYPILYFGRNAAAGIALKGENAVVPSVLMPKPVAGDRLGQRGSIGYKMMQGAVILNDAWMAVAEVAVKELA